MRPFVLVVVVSLLVAASLAKDSAQILLRRAEQLERQVKQFDLERVDDNDDDNENSQDDDNQAVSASLEEAGLSEAFTEQAIRLPDPPLDGILQPVCKPSERTKGYHDYVDIAKGKYECGCVCDASEKTSTGCFTCAKGALGFNQDAGSLMCEFCAPPSVPDPETNKCKVTSSQPDTYERRCPEGATTEVVEINANGSPTWGLRCTNVCNEKTEVLRENKCIVDGICGTAEVVIPNAKIDDVTAYTVVNELVCALPAVPGVKTADGVTTKYIVGTTAKARADLTSSDKVEGIQCQFFYDSPKVVEKQTVLPNCEGGATRMVVNGKLYCFRDRACPPQFEIAFACGAIQQDMAKAQSLSIVDAIMKLPAPSTRLTTSQREEIASAAGDAAYDVAAHYMSAPRTAYYTAATDIARCGSAFFRLTECVDYTLALRADKDAKQLANMKRHYNRYGTTCQANGASFLKAKPSGGSLSDIDSQVTVHSPKARTNAVLNDAYAQFSHIGSTVTISKSNIDSLNFPTSFAGPVIKLVVDCPTLTAKCLLNVLLGTNYASKRYAEAGTGPVFSCKEELKTNMKVVTKSTASIANCYSVHVARYDGEGSVTKDPYSLVQAKRGVV